MTAGDVTIAKSPAVIDRRYSNRSHLRFPLFRKPKALEFGDVRECLEIAHAIQIDLSHQVIELMLDDARGKAFGGEFEPVSMAVQPIHAKPAPAGNTAPHIGNAEASFPVFDKLFVKYGDIGIDQYRHRNVPTLSVALNDSNSEGLVNLRCSQAHTAVFDHGLHHIVDQRLNHRAGQSLFRYTFRFHSEHRMSKAANLQDGHDFQVCVG